jgi:hypothetical protein
MGVPHALIKILMIKAHNVATKPYICQVPHSSNSSEQHVVMDFRRWKNRFPCLYSGLMNIMMDGRESVPYRVLFADLVGSLLFIPNCRTNSILCGVVDLLYTCQKIRRELSRRCSNLPTGAAMPSKNSYTDGSCGIEIA